jgi:hypothetical protein
MEVDVGSLLDGCTAMGLQAYDTMATHPARPQGMDHRSELSLPNLRPAAFVYTMSTPKPRRNFAQLQLDLGTQVELETLKGELKEPSKAAVVRRLLRDMKERQKVLPIADFDNIMNTEPDVRTPVIICGLSGSGKSYSLAKFLQECLTKEVPFFLIDVAAEHGWVPRTLTYSSAIGFKFTGEGGCRVTLDLHQNMRRLQVQSLVETTLSGALLEGKLRKYVIAIEESHEFTDLKPVVDFVTESRKYVRKVVVCSSNEELWHHVGVAMRPVPLTES